MSRSNARSPVSWCHGPRRRGLLSASPHLLGKEVDHTSGTGFPHVSLSLFVLTVKAGIAASGARCIPATMGEWGVDVHLGFNGLSLVRDVFVLEGVGVVWFVSHIKGFF